MFGAILGALAGPVISGLMGSSGGDAQQAAGQAQAQLGRDIFEYGQESAQPYVSAGQDAVGLQQSLNGFGENAFDWQGSGAPEYAWMGEAGLTNPGNPFAGENFLDKVSGGAQLFDWDRTAGTYQDSNVYADNQDIMDRTMDEYGNTVLGGQLSGKALSGAVQTAGRTNASMRDAWTQQQLSNDVRSVNAGRQGISQDLSRRQNALAGVNGMASQGLQAVGTVTRAQQAGAANIAAGNNTAAQGTANSASAWNNAIGNGIDALSQPGVLSGFGF